MKQERTIIAYKHYFAEFISSVSNDVADKIGYVLDVLKIQQRISEKFVKAIRDGLYELRIEYKSNIYRVFFIFDEGNIVILFNGFQKKTQKAPSSEISKALKLKEEYYASKRTRQRPLQRR